MQKYKPKLTLDYDQALVSRSGKLIPQITANTGELKNLLCKTLDQPPFDRSRFGFDCDVPKHYPQREADKREDFTWPDLKCAMAISLFRNGTYRKAASAFIGECLLPNMEPTRWLPTPRAQEELVTIINDFLLEGSLEDRFPQAHEVIPKYTIPVPPKEADPNNPAALVRQPILKSGLTDEHPYRDPIPSSLAAKLQSDGRLVSRRGQVAYDLGECLWMVGVIGYTANREMINEIKRAFAEFLVAMCKQGNITPESAAKIGDQLRQQLGIKSFSIDPAKMRETYATFGPYCTEAVMIHIYDVWTALFSDDATALRTTVLQARGAGLTGITMIGEAFSNHPKFPWGQIIRLIGPSDFLQVREARQAFEHRPFAGYDSTTLAKHGLPKYRKLAFVAREILVVVDAQSSLLKYTGVGNSVPNYKKISEIIKSYAEGSMEDLDEEEMKKFDRQAELLMAPPPGGLDNWWANPTGSIFGNKSGGNGGNDSDDGHDKGGEKVIVDGVIKLKGKKDGKDDEDDDPPAAGGVAPSAPPPPEDLEGMPELEEPEEGNGGQQQDPDPQEDPEPDQEESAGPSVTIIPPEYVRVNTPPPPVIPSQSAETKKLRSDLLTWRNEAKRLKVLREKDRKTLTNLEVKELKELSAREKMWEKKFEKRIENAVDKANTSQADKTSSVVQETTVITSEVSATASSMNDEAPTVK